MMAFLNEQRKIIREVKIMKNLLINSFFTFKGQILTIFQNRGRITAASSYGSMPTVVVPSTMLPSTFIRVG